MKRQVSSNPSNRGTSEQRRISQHSQISSAKSEKTVDSAFREISKGAKWIDENEFTAEDRNNDMQVVSRILTVGKYPDGTLLPCFLPSAWEWDYYQFFRMNVKNQVEEGNADSSALAYTPEVDYYYAETPYKTNIGQTNLVCMNSTCVFEDGSRISPDNMCVFNKKFDA